MFRQNNICHGHMTNVPKRMGLACMRHICVKLFDNTRQTILPFLLELRSEVKVTVTQKQYVTLCTTGYIQFGIPTSNLGDMFLELKPEVKVTVTRK